MADDINKNRKKIDKIDKAIIELLGERKRITQELISSKIENHLPVEDLQRENDIISNLQSLAKNTLTPEFVSKIYNSIFKFSKENHSDELAKTNEIFEYIKNNKVIISGPCSVESLEQIDTTASQLKELGIKFLRGGCFKPRTSPNSFQGMGEKGLEYLSTTAKKYGMYSVSEVTAAHQFDMGFDNIDIIQIGSRNAMNFELLKAVGKYTAKTQKPVILKRGFWMTIPEFLSAADYIMNEGNKSVILCLRGIRTFEQISSKFRFTPDLASIIELKGQPLPVVFDPSHSAGDAKYVVSLGEAALAMGAGGLTIETHCLPECALSDAKQCIPPSAIKPLIDKINAKS